jgi:hypothetical protein
MTPLAFAFGKGRPLKPSPLQGRGLGEGQSGAADA